MSKNPTQPAKTPARASIAYQTHVLAERYFDVFLADWTSLFFLIFQPLAVAFFIGLIWQGGRPTATLYFVLIFSAIFFGCVNACREIVKEKAIYQRERLVGLKITPYILSKFGVLTVLGFGQTLLFYLGVRFYLTLDGPMLLLFLTLYLSLLAGTALGLLISSLVTSDVMALALVPVCLIPQLLFSKMVLPQQNLSGLASLLENTMLVTWSYQAMEEVVATEMKWGTFSQGLGILLLMTLGLVLTSGLLMRFKEL